MAAPGARVGAPAAHRRASVGDRDARAHRSTRGAPTLSDARLLVLGAPRPSARRDGGPAGERRARRSAADELDRARRHHRLGRDRGRRALGDVGVRPALRAAHRPHSGRRCAPQESRDPRAAPARRRLGLALAGRARLRSRANAIVAPSPSAARATRIRSRARVARVRRAVRRRALRLRRPAPRSRHRSGAPRASYSASALSGKAECRRALARRCSLALGPAHAAAHRRPAPPRRGRRGDPRRRRAARAVRRRDRHRAARRPDLVERARLLAIQHPGRVALLPGAEPGDERFAARGAADAILLGDDHDQAGRAAGLALALRDAADRARHGRQPRLPRRSTTSARRTGHALLYGAATPFEIESAVRRAIAAARRRRHLDGRSCESLLASAPRWAQTAAAVGDRRRDDRLRAPDRRRQRGR